MKNRKLKKKGWRSRIGKDENEIKNNFYEKKRKKKNVSGMKM